MSTPSTLGQDVISLGLQINKLLKNKASSSNISDSLQNKLQENSDRIQGLINSFAGKKGLLTTDEVNKLDEEIRLGKLNLLKADSEATLRNYGIYVVVGLGLFGALWYYTKKK